MNYEVTNRMSSYIHFRLKVVTSEDLNLQILHVSYLPTMSTIYHY